LADAVTRCQYGSVSVFQVLVINTYISTIVF